MLTEAKVIIQTEKDKAITPIDNRDTRSLAVVMIEADDSSFAEMGKSLSPVGGDKISWLISIDLDLTPIVVTLRRPERYLASNYRRQKEVFGRQDPDAWFSSSEVMFLII